jgi:nucleotide-binding universal stress UspA family protein
MLQKVLVPLDGSQLSELALSYLREILPPGGHVLLLSAVDLPLQMQPGYEVAVVPSIDTIGSIDQSRQVTQLYLRNRAQELRDAGYTVDTIVEVGYPEEFIIRHAREQNVDAIVMSTHGRSGLGRMLFGSVTQRVLNAMPCPVFVVPNRERRQPLPGQDRLTAAQH